MEKLIYRLEMDAPCDRETIVQIIRDGGGLDIRLNMRDAVVAAGDKLIQQNSARLPDCVLQFWLPSSNTIFREHIDRKLLDLATSASAWLVCESTIIENENAMSDGQRCEGFAQIACLTLPSEMDWQEWRRIWRDDHTQVAIDTQSNFEYRQNLVVECILNSSRNHAENVVAIVEECFPIAALGDSLTFFDAPGDPEKFKRNLDVMMESCARFIAPGTIEVFPTSQYNFAQAVRAEA